MVNAKKLLTATALAGAFGLGLLATSSFASGPLALGGVAPTTAVPTVTTTVSPVSVQTKVLSTYRQIRAFWLSRAIVR